MGKKSIKKNKYNVGTNVDNYKEEFLSNIDITKNNNLLKKNLINLSHGVKFFNSKTNNSVLLEGGVTLNNTFLKISKSSFSSENFLNTNNKYVFFNFSDDKFFKINLFKRYQFFSDKGGFVSNNQLLKTSKTWVYNNNDSYNKYFGSIFTKNNNTLIQHPDLDDETRVIKRNLGKNSPIRVLKQPKSDFFIFDSSQQNYLELLRFRFNESITTTTNKPIKPTVYLTFKQKRYNQRNIIGKKNLSFVSYDNSKIQKYSGNPFLKNSSIIEDNFGNPTRQYRMVKKAKTRVDNTRVGN